MSPDQDQLEEDLAVQPPRASSTPPKGRKFPCPACGARLDFDPASQALACPYCGHQEAIAASLEEVKELDYQEYLSKLAGVGKAIPGHECQVSCPGCGAVLLLEDKVATEQCPFCATHLESEPERASNLIQPEGILPFSIEEREARRRFNAWVESLWFAPSALKSLANLGQLAGVYLPFWTYDSMTNSHYTGERGTDYTELQTYTDYETVTETDSSGQTRTSSRPVTKTRTVVRTLWTPVAGRVQHFFDDVLVCASHSLSEAESRSLAPWDLAKIEPFQAQFLSSFKTERYAVSLPEGFEQAKKIMDKHITELCRRDIGGDHQRVHSVRSQYLGITFKHLLLPTWMGVYRYQNEPFRVLINARTGRVFGRRPYSAAKIISLVLAILLLLGSIGLFIWWRQRQGPAGHPQQRPAPARRVETLPRWTEAPLPLATLSSHGSFALVKERIHQELHVRKIAPRRSLGFGDRHRA